MRLLTVILPSHLLLVAHLASLVCLLLMLSMVTVIVNAGREILEGVFLLNVTCFVVVLFHVCLLLKNESYFLS